MGQLFRGSKVGLTISVERDKLIGILTDNRQKHEAHVEGYKRKLIEHAMNNLELAKAGKHPKHFNQSSPRSTALFGTVRSRARDVEVDRRCGCQPVSLRLRPIRGGRLGLEG